MIESLKRIEVKRQEGIKANQIAQAELNRSIVE